MAVMHFASQRCHSHCIEQNFMIHVIHGDMDHVNDSYFNEYWRFMMKAFPVLTAAVFTVASLSAAAAADNVITTPATSTIPPAPAEEGKKDDGAAPKNH